MNELNVRLAQWAERQSTVADLYRKYGDDSLMEDCCCCGERLSQIDKPCSECLLHIAKVLEGDNELSRLIDWLRSSDRKPPELAFTSGSLREAADLIDLLLQLSEDDK